ncbi:trehalose-phosphatase [Nonomuraea gerenzanensis]|uniref:Trehalose 6-phosphate phosphatase n=1 Tax=Nonomuraea gerenzanensis TaxID=93944 RepID=A0A1M4E6M5_9ACTN|nr:trehalose-phosphatase [Nonomuraea gerenzanensis]UBU16796.1 trehalose-phosphatase [Nonomuraea gerenzanensis]SBO94506.1 Trehalose-6-phosphate phosphatase [Nonomuraea gerenzanensis]
MATSRAPLPFTEAVSATVAQSTRSGFFFDFDGTIAPIMRDPAAVFPVPGAVERLRVLAELVGRVAIVSARPAAFLCERLAGVPRLGLFGLYGMQSVVDGRVRTEAEAGAWAPVIARVAADAARELPGEVLVEDKALMVALHYRSSPSARGAVERWASAKAAELGLREQYGRMVVELRPPVEGDKGTLVARETEALTRAWYFGDDLSDGRAFDALRGREERDPAFLGIRVAVANGETGDELARLADFTIDAPEHTPAMLDHVIRAFRATPYAG